MKRTLARAVSCLLIAGMLLTGCSQTQTPAPTASTVPEPPASTMFNSPGTFPILKEKVTLKFAMPQSANVQDYTTNKFTKYLSEKVNINFDFVILPAADAKQKLAVMVNAKTSCPTFSA